MEAPQRSELALQTQLRLVEDLQAARSRFDALARRASSTWLAIDETERIEYLSPGWLKLSRKPAAELLGADWRTAFDDTHLEAGRLLPVEARERDRSCRARRIDLGALGWLLELSPIEPVTEPAAPVADPQPSSAKVSPAVDERWNWLQERLPQALVAFDADDRLSDFNGAAAALAGPERWEVGAPGRGFLEACGFREEAVEQILGQTELIEREWPAARPLGRRLRVSARCRSDAAGTHAERLVLIQALDAEAEPGTLRESFLTALSHEMKTPLTSIRGFGELLLNDAPADAEDTELLRRLVHESYRMEGLIDELLGLAELSANLNRTRHDSSDFVRLLWEALFRATRQAQERHVELAVVRAPERAPVTLDERLMGLALDQLLGHALERSPAGSEVHIELQCERRRLTLRVFDEGRARAVPITDQALRDLLRGGQAANEPIDAGRRLAMVEAIARGHGGRVQLLEPRDGFSGVELSLPLGG